MTNSLLSAWQGNFTGQQTLPDIARTKYISDQATWSVEVERRGKVENECFCEKGEKHLEEHTKQIDYCAMFEEGDKEVHRDRHWLVNWE